MEILAQALPDGATYELLHVHNHPKRARRLIFTRKNDQSLSVQSTHLFILSYNAVPVLSLEALVDEAPDMCTLFISKADTSGWYDGPPLKTAKIIQALISLLLQNYINHAKPTRIAVFAYSQPEYLFLGSKDNPAKHVLTDSQLVKWWIRCLDAVVPTEFSSVTKACLRIPGEEGSLDGFFPTNSALKWTNGDIYWQGNDYEAEDTALAIQRIPRFPDDPKTRFLENLYLEKRAKKVTRRQFWLELQSRQEFRLNKSMGIIGVEGLVKTRNESKPDASAVSYKDLSHFKETLLDNDFSSKQHAAEAMEELRERCPEEARVEIVGKCKLPAATNNAPKIEPVKRINHLDGGLVRKKQRT